jgi:hypothetical protein
MPLYTWYLLRACLNLQSALNIVFIVAFLPKKNLLRREKVMFFDESP